MEPPENTKAGEKRRRQTLESKGFKLGRTKTEYMRCGFSTTTREEEVSLDGTSMKM
jgi:hypothetical protein